MPTLMKDYYKILRVDPSAEPEVIEAAYRKLAQLYHPDVDSSPYATAQMQEINEAYRALRDPAERAAYDIAQSAQDERERAERGQAENEWHTQAERRQKEHEKAEREQRARAERDEYERLLKERQRRQAGAERRRVEQEEVEREHRKKAALDAEFEIWLRENPNSRAEYEHQRREQIETQEQRDKLEHQQSESAETAQCHVELEQQQIEPERPNTEIKSQPSEQPEAKQRRTERWRLSPGRVFFLALALWLAITMVAKEVSLNDEV